MITNGFVVTDKLSNEDINEIIETAQVLLIEMREVYHDKAVPIKLPPAPDSNLRSQPLIHQRRGMMKTQNLLLMLWTV